MNAAALYSYFIRTILLLMSFFFLGRSQCTLVKVHLMLSKLLLSKNCNKLQKPYVTVVCSEPHIFAI